MIQCNCYSEDGGNQAVEQDELQAELDDDRDCQIGTAPTKGKEAHKTVDQLMDWRHYAPPFYDGVFEVSASTIFRLSKSFKWFIFRIFVWMRLGTMLLLFSAAHQGLILSSHCVFHLICVDLVSTRNPIRHSEERRVAIVTPANKQFVLLIPVLRGVL